MKAEPGRAGWPAFLRAAILIGVSFWIYAPAFRGEWIWDDAMEVTRSRVLRDPAGLGLIWRGAFQPDYYPLKATALWVEWRLFGENVLGYHLVNVGLHVLSALLLWRLLERLFVATVTDASERRPYLAAWCGGMLFAVHPVAVESVAWISEFKNVLALPLLLLAFGAWIEGSVWVSLLWFTLSLLAKTSGVMFPAVLLLYAWWRRGRVGRRDVGAALPFAGVSLALGMVTVWFQHTRAIAGADLALGGALPRLAAAGTAAVFYFSKAMFPVHLAPNYPRWALEPASLGRLLPWLALAAPLAWLAVRSGRRPRAGGALFGVGFFLVNLAPVLGFIPMSYLRIAWAADHLAYLPLVGVVGVGAAGVGWWMGRKRMPGRLGETSLPLAAVLLGVLAAVSRGEARLFGRAETFWAETLRRNPESWTAANDLGKIRREQGRPREAAELFARAVQLNPADGPAHFNLGLVLEFWGRNKEAEDEFRAALRLLPDLPEGRRSLGNVLLRLERRPEAMVELRRALRVAPGYAEAHGDLGIALAGSGRLPEAMEELAEAVRLKPDYAEAWYNLGLTQADGGRLAEAAASDREAIRLEPNYAAAHNNLGVALLRLGRLEEARGEFEAALRLDPGYAAARANLALLGSR